MKYLNNKTLNGLKIITLFGLILFSLPRLNAQISYPKNSPIKSNSSCQTNATITFIKPDYIINTSIIRLDSIPKKKSFFAATGLWYIFPGLGEYYAKNNIAGTAFLISELAVGIGLIANGINQGSYNEWHAEPSLQLVQNANIMIGVLIALRSLELGHTLYSIQKYNSKNKFQVKYGSRLTGKIGPTLSFTF